MPPRSRLALLGALAAGCSAPSPNSPAPPHNRVDDDFEAGNLDAWTVYNPQDATYSVAGGQLLIQPDPNTAWYANNEAIHIYQLVQGDFAVTSRIEATNLAGGPALPSWRLGGLLVRDPTGGPVDAYHGALGTVGAWMSPNIVVEYKSTISGGSVLGFVPHPAGSGELRICRAEGSVRTVFRGDGETDWTLVDERPRADLPNEVAVGPMAYAFNPVADFQAAFDHVDFETLGSMAECETVIAGSDESGTSTSTGTGTTGSSTSDGSSSSSSTSSGGSSSGGSSTTGGPGGATLPPHGALNILVVSDEANPYFLTDAELTQPGELAAAIGDPDSGVNVGSIQEVDSGCVDAALTALGGGTVDVIVYFAHAPAAYCGGGSAQAALTAAFEDHLQSGGGVVVFHHGIFELGGKGPILDLLGGRATEYEWHAAAGQNVINVAPSHFVTTNEVSYGSTVQLGDAGLGIPVADYDAMLNAPDERYPDLSLTTEAGEDRELLFASDYDGVQILGWDLQRVGWAGRVVAYQPGEYQPNALDLDGESFQILANAIYYVGTYDGGVLEGGSSSGGTTDGTSDTSTGGDSTGGSTGTTSGGSTGGDSTGGSTGTTSGGSTGGDSTGGSTGGDPGTCVASYDGSGDLAQLSDEFDDPATLACWQLRHEVDGESAQYSVLDVDASTPGELTIIPDPSGWYNDHRGIFMFKEVTGDFMLEVSADASSLADPSTSPSLMFSAAGIMVRDPDASPGDEDWIMYDVGAQWNAGVGTAAKNTNGSSTSLSQAFLASSGRLRICRVGNEFILARRLDGQASFAVTNQYTRADLPQALDVGIAASAWGWGSGVGPNPNEDADLLATWDYARFSPITAEADCVAD